MIFKWLRRRREGCPIVIFHEFKKPPYGGGNQFLLALKSEFEKQGLEVGVNHVGTNTKVVLFNSYNFDFDRLKKMRRSGIHMIHRVDGPIGVYRGTDVDIDRKIWQMNSELADATVFQSQYSLRKHDELGLHFKNPSVVFNAVNPSIFFPKSEVRAFTNEARKSRIKLIASAWSNNPRKGATVYKWLDENLDHTRFEFTFVGRIETQFKNSTHVEAVPSEQLAEILRAQDIYITASQDDPCSNALIEALSCGLPSIYLKSGGHPELVGHGGLGFDRAEEIPVLLDRLIAGYENFRSNIRVPQIDEVAKQYLKILGFESKERP